MNIESFYNYCSALPGATEDFPFGEDVLVFKVKGKMFALTHIDNFQTISLKCDPVRALELRAQYEEVKPGYHMNKKHWNSINAKGSLDDEFIEKLIKHSYELVVDKLPKKDQNQLLA